MMRRLLAISIITAITGPASTPLTTAPQYSALIGGHGVVAAQPQMRHQGREHRPAPRHRRGEHDGDTAEQGQGQPISKLA